MLATYGTQKFLGACDGMLFNLKNKSLNGKPIIFRGYNTEKERFIVELFEFTSSPPRRMLIQDKNIRSVKPRPLHEAYDDFKDAVHESWWNMVTLGGSCLGNKEILREFIMYQFSYGDEETINSSAAYVQLVTEVVSEIHSQSLKISDTDCQQIISFLYSFCFSRQSPLHVIRRFLIPRNWKLTKWKGKSKIYLPLPSR